MKYICNLHKHVALCKLQLFYSLYCEISTLFYSLRNVVGDWRNPRPTQNPSDAKYRTRVSIDRFWITLITHFNHLSKAIRQQYYTWKYGYWLNILPPADACSNSHSRLASSSFCSQDVVLSFIWRSFWAINNSRSAGTKNLLKVVLIEGSHTRSCIGVTHHGRNILCNTIQWYRCQVDLIYLVSIWLLQGG